MKAIVVLALLGITLAYVQAACNDQNKNCAYWSSKGFCTGQYERYMKQNCQKSCKICDDGSGGGGGGGGGGSQGSCGRKPSTRIVGGQAAPANAWPWMAQLRTSSGFPFCGGTLVTPTFVVTASHCIVGKSAGSLRIRLGAHQRRGSGESTVQDFQVKRIIKHESYSKPQNLANDIALIELASPAQLGAAVNVACLPETSQTIAEGKRCWVTGWGRLSEGGSSPNVLMQVEVPIVSQQTCSKAYGRIHESMVCAGRSQGGIDSCQGDSGGPLVCEYNGKYNLEGVVSWGSGCARPGKYGVYAKVRHLKDWVKKYI